MPTENLASVSRSQSASVIRAYDAQVDSIDQSERSLVARINTSHIDRYRSVIDPKGGKLENYRKNPVALWEHGKDPRRFTDPIGRNLWIRTNGGERPTELLAKTKFLDDEFSQQRYEWYRDGVLNAFSVNVLPDDSGTSPPTKEEIRSRPELESCQIMYRSWDLAEYSGTSVPGNPHTLAGERAVKLMDAVQRGLWLPDDIKPIIEAAARTMTDSEGGLAGGGATVTPTQRFIRKKGEKWVVYSEAGKVLGEHDNEPDAKKQLAAIEANKDRTATWIEHTGLTYTVRSPDGLPILATLDQAIALECIEAMGRYKPIERTHADLIQVARKMRDERKLDQVQFKEEIIALVDLMVHGRV